MKKLFLTLFLILTLAGASYAADAMVVTLEDNPNDNLRVVHLAWTDSPALTIESQSTGFNAWIKGWYLFKVQTIPGTAAAQPDDDYDITITDAEGVDLMGGETMNRDETNGEEAVPKIDAVYSPQPIISALTITVSGQATAAATGEIYLFFARY